MTETLNEKALWRYSINYGPEGEANYAFVYDADGHLVSNLKTNHAIAVVAAMNASSLPAGDYAGLVDELMAEVAEQRQMGEPISGSKVEEAATAITTLVAERNSPWTDVTPQCAEYLAAISRAEAAEAQVKAMDEALENISMMHDGNMPDALAGMSELDYARRTISSIHSEARRARAVKGGEHG